MTRLLLFLHGCLSNKSVWEEPLSFHVHPIRTPLTEEETSRLLRLMKREENFSPNRPLFLIIPPLFGGEGKDRKRTDHLTLRLFPVPEDE
ncbi:hypothetical protein AVEN_66841-1 [Araneus ventricosus]|uniref:Uncharacterized protein n=1 Tax=Araneus ventricosus TaxID=182803 RepID=A0A4Y2DNT9_ARAVE|nr:hypothetical protein AVEN_66841-1 [Araneus ventricosus]